MPSGPVYEPIVVAKLARQGNVVATLRVVSWLTNHDYDALKTITGILSALPLRGRWIGSTRLRNAQSADEYIVTWQAEDWYVKLYIDDDEVVVNVWSCCWDGAPH